jgi:hypothetical protein
MGGWVVSCYLFTICILIISNFGFFKCFWLHYFLSYLTNQKDHLMVNKKKPSIKLDVVKST